MGPTGVGADIHDPATQSPLPGFDGVEVELNYRRSAPTPPPSELAELQAINPDFAERAMRVSESIVDTQNSAVVRVAGADSFGVRAGAIVWPLVSSLGLVLAFVGGVLFDNSLAFALASIPFADLVMRGVVRLRD